MSDLYPVLLVAVGFGMGAVVGWIVGVLRATRDLE